MSRQFALVSVVALLAVLSCRENAGGAEPVPAPPVPTPTQVLSLSNHDVDDNGRIVMSSHSLLTGVIHGGRGFHIKLHSGYRVYSVHLVDNNGNVIVPNYLYPDTWNAATRSDWKGDWRDEYGSDLIPRQFCVRLVIRHVNESAVSPTERIVESFVYLDDPEFTRLSARVDGYSAVKKRFTDLSQVQWVPLAKVAAAKYPQGVSFRNYYYTASKTYIGVPYSENNEYSRYIGQHVSLYTFLTAVHNRRSVLYTEDISSTHPMSGYGISYHGLGERYCAAFYGTVCCGLTGYVMGLDNVYGANAYADGTIERRLGSSDYVQVSPDDVQPLDLIWNSGHISIVTDVIVDRSGEKRFVIWGEQSKPGSYATPYTAQRFAERVSQVEARIFRWNGWGKSQTNATPWMDIPTDNIVYNEDISTMYGDKPTVAQDEVFYLNLNRGNGYPLLEIYPDNNAAAPVCTVDISDRKHYPSDAYGGDWVAFDVRPLGLAPGKYKARLANGLKASAWLRWEIIGIDMRVSLKGSSASVDFECDGGVPYLLRAERTDGLSAGTHALTDAEVSAGHAAVPTSRNATCVKMFVRGEYGVATHRVFF